MTSMTREQAIRALKEKINYYESDKRLKAAIETLIPELAESEDERIRKEIVNFFKNFKETGTWKSISDVNTWIAHLEKQKEPKWSPSEDEMGVLYKLCYISNQVTDEDDTELTRLYQDLKREYFNGHSFENMFPSGKQKCPEFCNGQCVDCEQKEQKPVPISCGHENGTTTEVCYDPKGDPDPAGVWKPSKEQIYSLGTVVKGSGDCIAGSVGYHLKEMYEQLKKLI